MLEEVHLQIHADHAQQASIFKKFIIYSACAGASGVPEACPMGYYCPYGAKMMCPAGYYSGYRSGLRTMDECVVCPAGFYCPEGAPDPIPAPLVFLMLTITILGLLQSLDGNVRTWLYVKMPSILSLYYHRSIYVQRTSLQTWLLLPSRNKSC